MKLRDRVEVRNAPDLVENEFGNPVPDWGTADSKIEPAEVAPLSTTEDTTGQETTVTRYRMLLGTRTAARDDSRIVWRGVSYEVIGEVQLVPDHRGRAHHHEALLERVK